LSNANHPTLSANHEGEKEKVENMNYKEIRLKCNRFERIILDILYMWQFNRTYFLKEEGGEQFYVDELLEVIGEYAPWSSKDRELPISAVYNTLRWFEKEGLIKRINDDAWEINESILVD
jgi:hypothetical protein